ncbi:MAG: hypothetical protein FJ358_03610 [Thaumarchaeota archaeon]|nr:hypothetical protein [Nitrososphaerota archaeon]
MERRFEPLKGLEKLYIKEISLTTSISSIMLDETFDLTVKVSLAGGAREAFNQETWLKAYENGDKIYRIAYRIEIKKGSIIPKNVVTQKFVRKASFYWTRNPDLNPDYSKKAWVMIILEGREPVIPKNEDESRTKLFDIEKTFHVLGSDLGKGRHTLKAFAKASWGRHIFGDKGKVEKVSAPIRVTCK